MIAGIVASNGLVSEPYPGPVPDLIPNTTPVTFTIVAGKGLLNPGTPGSITNGYDFNRQFGTVTPASYSYKSGGVTVSTVGVGSANCNAPESETAVQRISYQLSLYNKATGVGVHCYVRLYNADRSTLILQYVSNGPPETKVWPPGNYTNPYNMLWQPDNLVPIRMIEGETYYLDCYPEP